MYERLNEKLEWKHGRTYVPKGNKRLICLVDDLNLSHVSHQICHSQLYLPELPEQVICSVIKEQHSFKKVTEKQV